MGNPRDLDWLQTPANAQPAFGDTTNGVTFASGKGTVWMIPAGEEKDIQRRLEKIAAQVLPPRPVVIGGDYEYRTIPWKNDKGEDGYVTYILNEWSAGGVRTVPAVFNENVESMVDLVTDTSVDSTAIQIPPNGVLLLEWHPRSF